VQCDARGAGGALCCDALWPIRLPFTGEFEVVIMIEVVTEEMHGSD
jgi:hypothetical protein